MAPKTVPVPVATAPGDVVGQTAVGPSVTRVFIVARVKGWVPAGAGEGCGQGAAEPGAEEEGADEQGGAGDDPGQQVVAGGVLLLACGHSMSPVS